MTSHAGSRVANSQPLSLVLLGTHQRTSFACQNADPHDWIGRHAPLELSLASEKTTLLKVGCPVIASTSILSVIARNLSSLTIKSDS